VNPVSAGPHESPGAPGAAAVEVATGQAKTSGRAAAALSGRFGGSIRVVVHWR
jgi:hypothetical protein